MNPQDTDTRTPDEVNRHIAELMGWKYVPDPVGGVRSAHWQHSTGVWRDYVPDYYHDLNALHDGPEATLRAAALKLSVDVYLDHAVVSWWSDERARTNPEITAPTEAAARALAAEAALREMQEAK